MPDAMPETPSQSPLPAVPETWPALALETRGIGELSPYPRNARTHSAAQVEQIADSIQEWGWTVPLVIDEDGVILAGHGRWQAAQKLGIKQIPVAVARGWSEEQKRAYVLADNRIALNAGWEKSLLKKEAGDLQAAKFDLKKVGFTDVELKRMLAQTRLGITDENDVPEPPAEPVAKVGETWILGRHRLVCGDATRQDDVARCLAGATPHLMVTDPPYGVDYNPAWREGVDLGVGERSKGLVRNDDRADWRAAWKLFPGDVCYVWHGGKQAAVVQQSLEAAGFEVRAQIIWAKQHFALSRGNYHWQHEPCWYAVRKGGEAHWEGGHKQSTVWQIANNNSFGNADAEETWGHGTQKPVECMKRPIGNSSLPSDAVYDPFVGSGTSIIAAEVIGRSCHAIELEPRYVDVCIERWQRFTGEKAVRADG